MRLAEIMRACVLLLLRLTHLQGLQSPTKLEREVFLMWECLKLFGHLLMYFHKSGLGGQRTTTTGRKHVHWKGHQRINLCLATVLTPAGKDKEMIHTTSRQIPDEIQGKIAYQKPKE